MLRFCGLERFLTREQTGDLLATSPRHRIHTLNVVIALRKRTQAEVVGCIELRVIRRPLQLATEFSMQDREEIRSVDTADVRVENGLVIRISLQTARAAPI